MNDDAPGPRGLDGEAIQIAFEEILADQVGRAPTSAHLVAAYLHGIFPMARGARGKIDWVEPYTRGVFDLEAFHVPKNVAREVRKGRFEIRTDTAFERVMRECAKPRGPSNGTWMCKPLLEAYLDLFARGCCHSVEAWLVESPGSAKPRARAKETLVGGLYGVHLGAAVFGESMFSRPALGGRNASKVCRVHLVERLRRQGFRLLDAQMMNRHLAQFGIVPMSAQAFHRRLDKALAVPAAWE
ncbi:MAG: leucyl/phenylalanyl-tRNA--protein transferase [Phycisphaerales bacterium]